VDSSIEIIPDSMGSGMRARYFRLVISMGKACRLDDWVCLIDRRFGRITA